MRCVMWRCATPCSLALCRVVAYCVVLHRAAMLCLALHPWQVANVPLLVVQDQHNLQRQRMLQQLRSQGSSREHLERVNAALLQRHQQQIQVSVPPAAPILHSSPRRLSCWQFM